jgi:hypothetical protein
LIAPINSVAASAALVDAWPATTTGAARSFGVRAGAGRAVVLAGSAAGVYVCVGANLIVAGTEELLGDETTLSGTDPVLGGIAI